MTEKMLKFVDISKETPTKIKSSERKENFHEINKKEYANAPLMSHYEQTISFLNRYFIFKKMIIKYHNKI